MADEKPITESMHMTIVAGLDEHGGYLPPGVKVMQRNALVKRGLVTELKSGKYKITAAGRKAIGAAPKANPALENDDLGSAQLNGHEVSEPTLDEVAAEDEAADQHEADALADQAAHEVAVHEAEKPAQTNGHATNGHRANGKPSGLTQAVSDALSSIRAGRLGSQARNIAAGNPQRDGEADTRYVGRLRHVMYVQGSTSGGDALQLVKA